MTNFEFIKSLKDWEFADYFCYLMQEECDKCPFEEDGTRDSGAWRCTINHWVKEEHKVGKDGW